MLLTSDSSTSPLSASRKRLNDVFDALQDINLAGKIIDQEPEQLGMGSTCDVFRAKSTVHNAIVAVKRIRFFLLDNMSFAGSLAREVRLWSRLDHPNVVPLLGFFLEGPKGIPNLVSEWMKNGTVVDYVGNNGLSADGKELCRIVREIAVGLDYIHDECRIVHADLKGSNILMSDDGRPLLADFGLAVSSSSGSLGPTTYHGGKGSLRWMAKELHSSSLNDSEIPTHTIMTDMWAFGMVIYELLTLQIPYANITSDWLIPAAILDGQLPGRPFFSNSTFSDYPYNLVLRGLWSIACDCWNDNPKWRPSASDIGYQLGMPVDNTSRSVAELIDNTEKKITVVNFLSYQTEMEGHMSLLRSPGVEIEDDASSNGSLE